MSNRVWSPVHPRVRGEQFTNQIHLQRLPGSSPRARGTGRCRPACRRRSRFIPACAGYRRAGSRACGRWPVHPRVRGEQLGTFNDADGSIGSSPRARGTGHHPQPGQRRHRFIPACAGNSICAEMAAGRDPVHPRVRGEQPTSSALYHHSAGSSPRARGTGAPPSTLRQTSRFIPACAGNSFPRGSSARAWSVHPRVRGEQSSRWSEFDAGSGSSPRARGTDPHSRAKWDRARFIPACAGNSGLVVGSPSLPPVHPRVRGEQGMRSAGGGPKTGSSPRARGTEEPADEPHQAHRFIPACAGNSSRSRLMTMRASVHPRVRGEQPSALTA